MPVRIRVLIILIIFIITSVIFTHISSAQTTTSPDSETDFDRDVRMGMAQTASNSAASVLQKNIEENQIVAGKISTSTGIDVVEVIKSMDQSDSKTNFSPTEEVSQTITVQPTVKTAY